MSAGVSLSPIIHASCHEAKWTPSQESLRKAAEALEANFLNEMLGHAGLGEARSEFGGGVGEEQFASFLRNEQAALMVRAGGIGLAEAVFAALSRSVAHD